MTHPTTNHRHSSDPGSRPRTGRVRSADAARRSAAIVLGVVAIATAATPVGGGHGEFLEDESKSPCTSEWIPTIGGAPGVGGGGVYALVGMENAFGEGPALFVGGWFDSAGGVAANGIARWDGAAWSPVGGGVVVPSGPGSGVRALAVFDDGGGTALYAAGDFTSAGGVAANGIAKWNGVAWSPLRGGLSDSQYTSRASALAVHDDGSGPALFVGGRFSLADGTPAQSIAKWDGRTWSAVGLGLGPGLAEVLTLATFDDGSGPALYAGGTFEHSGGSPMYGVAKWNGKEWSPLGEGISDGWVFSLAVFDHGGVAGPQLYAAGNFATAGGVPANRVARWDGAEWSPVGGGMNSAVRALASFDDGAGGGGALYAGGWFTTADGKPAQRVARWNGVTWSPVGDGLDFEGVWAFAPDPSPTRSTGVRDGRQLVVGGNFSTAGGAAADSIARWDGAAWSAYGHGPNREVHALALGTDSSGASLVYAGGVFSSIGGVSAGRIAAWDGLTWTPLGSGMAGTGVAAGGVRALACFDDGAGVALYAGGAFTIAGGTAANNIARWNGEAWSPLGAGVGIPSSGPPVVTALQAFDDGHGVALYAGGNFNVAGGAPAHGVARWDGRTWTPLGEGVNGPVHALAVFDAGDGAELYAGGSFSLAGGAPAMRVARWNGERWSDVAGGMDGWGSVYALEVLDAGNGPALYAGGSFVVAGGQPANRIARFDGQSWSTVGNGIGPASVGITSIALVGSGSRRTLVAGGDFTFSGDGPASRLAQWDGAHWSPLDAGVNDTVHALLSVDTAPWLAPSGGSELLVAGRFRVSPASDSYIARWRTCPESVGACVGDIDGDGAVGPPDLTMLLGAWGSERETPADLDGDGAVGASDLAILLGAWGACPAAR